MRRGCDHGRPTYGSHLGTIQPRETLSSMTNRTKILAAITNEDLRPLERLTMCMLLYHDNPSNPDLVELTGLSNSAVCRHLAKFEELGLITRERDGRTGRSIDHVENTW